MELDLSPIPLTDWLRSTARVIVGELLGESDRDNRGLETWDTCPGIGGTRVGVTVTEHVCCCSDIWQCIVYKILQTTKWISDQDEIIKQRNKNLVWECQCRRSWQQPSELESHHQRSQIWVLIQLSLFKEPPLFLHFHIHDPLFPVVSSDSVYPGSDTLPPLTIPPHISRIPLSNVSMGPTPGSVTTLANRRKWLVIAGLAHHNLELRPWLIHSVTPRSLWFLSSLVFIFQEYTGFEIDLRFSKKDDAISSEGRV